MIFEFWRVLFSSSFGSFFASFFALIFGTILDSFWGALGRLWGDFWAPKSIIFGINFSLFFCGAACMCVHVFLCVCEGRVHVRACVFVCVRVRGRPKSAQERPKSAQERPKSTQERPKSGQKRHLLLFFVGVQGISCKC